MSLTVKAVLQKSGSEVEEIRLFSVLAVVSSSYEYLCRKISDIFPSLRHGRFTIYWKDSEGDLVTFSTDEELLEALGFVKDSLLKIYVREKASSDSSKEAKAELHTGVVCDKAFVGSRYKSMECQDYNPCVNYTKIEIHKEHDMMKITTPIRTGYCVPPTTGHPPHIGFSFGPHGPHGPPLFRRWTYNNMKCWLNRNCPGCLAENETEEAKKQKGEKPEMPETEEQGIDVSIDVEHHGHRHRCEEEEKGGHGTGSCPGCGHHDHGIGDGCLWKQKEEKDAKSEEQSDAQYSELTPPSSPKEDGWTMLSINQVISSRDMEIPSTASSEETCVLPLHPDPKISEALYQMLAMGFNNDGGWLTNLLVSVNGDIGRALDAMKSISVSTGHCRYTPDGTWPKLHKDIEEE